MATNATIAKDAAGLVAPAALRFWDCGQVLDRALESAHVPRKVAAAAMGWGERELGRAIAGAGPEHLSFDRMTRLPRQVWGALLVEIAAVYGYAPSAEDRAERLARVAMRMVKARLAGEIEEVDRADVA